MTLRLKTDKVQKNEASPLFTAYYDVFDDADPEQKCLINFSVQGDTAPEVEQELLRKFQKIIARLNDNKAPLITMSNQLIASVEAQIYGS